MSDTGKLRRVIETATTILLVGLPVFFVSKLWRVGVFPFPFGPVLLVGLIGLGLAALRRRSVFLSFATSLSAIVLVLIALKLIPAVKSRFVTGTFCPSYDGFNEDRGTRADAGPSIRAD